MPRLIVTCLLVALIAGGCGGSDATPERERREANRPGATERRATEQPRASATCERNAARTTPARDIAAARAELAVAVRTTTASDHRFRIRLRMRAGRLPLPPNVIAGRRLATNASDARATWPGAHLRVVGDHLYLRLDSTGRWQDLGSASGASIDVGRELLTHPFLLRPVAASRADRTVQVRFVAPARNLRAYATSERRGPVTELLRRARRLEIVATAVDGRLVSDEFLLETTAPGGLPLVRAGAALTITGASAYCDARPRDRSPIAVPRARP